MLDEDGELTVGVSVGGLSRYFKREQKRKKKGKKTKFFFKKEWLKVWVP